MDVVRKCHLAHSLDKPCSGDEVHVFISRRTRILVGLLYDTLAHHVLLGGVGLRCGQYHNVEGLLQLEIDTGLELITMGELKTIDKMWDEEGDLTCRRLVDIYYKVKGKKLPWDPYKAPRFDEEAIVAIEEVAAKFDIPVELITKLIVSVDENKHITRNNKLQKAFDQIISQNWLHYNSIERAFDNED